MRLAAMKKCLPGCEDRLAVQKSAPYPMIRTCIPGNYRQQSMAELSMFGYRRHTTPVTVFELIPATTATTY